MKKETKKISSEVAIGIIVLFSVVVGIAIYRAGSFSAALDYLPQIANKRETNKGPERILFATNGEREVYKMKTEDGKWVVIIDGEAGEAYDDVFNPVFSDDGTQFAYGARNDGWEFVVLDNRASEKKYGKIGQLIFSHDGVLIYKVIGEDGEFLVIGDEEGQKYTHIGEIVILDDGRIAYQAEIDGETVTIIDGQIVEDEPASEDEQGSSGDNGDTDDENDDNNNDSSDYEIPKVKIKTDRPKKDTVVPTTETSYPVCDGVDCNF